MVLWVLCFIVFPVNAIQKQLGQVLPGASPLWSLVSPDTVDKKLRVPVAVVGQLYQFKAGELLPVPGVGPFSESDAKSMRAAAVEVIQLSLTKF